MALAFLKPILNDLRYVLLVNKQFSRIPEYLWTTHHVCR